MKKWLAISSCLMIFGCIAEGYSQTIGTDTSNSRYFLRKELAFRMIAHSSGFGFGVTKAYHKNILLKRVWEAEITNMKAPKEVKSVYPFADNSKSYVYGKLNYFFLIRGGYGMEQRLNRKPYWGGLEVRYFYHAGFSLGFEKPIYLYIIQYIPNSNEYRLTTEKYDPDQHFYDNIYGRASFGKGLDESKIHPGIYGKAGFQFDFGVDNDRVRTLNTGVALDFYPDPVRIMAFNKKENLFLTLFISLDIGKRYNRNIKSDKPKEKES